MKTEKKNPRKLQIRRETLRQLSNSDLRQVNGGVDWSQTGPCCLPPPPPPPWTQNGCPKASILKLA